jgi:hypothetical protein
VEEDLQNPDRVSSGKRATVVVILVLSLGGCVSHTWAPGPGMSTADFGQSKARCSLLARHSGSGFAASGSANYVAVATLGHAIGESIRANQDFNDCMEATGWRIADQPPVVATVAAPIALTAPSPAPAVAAAPVALTPAPAVPTAVLAAASTPAYPPSPVPTAVASPATAGQTVLFPVTINQPYQPHWTVGGAQ